MPRVLGERLGHAMLDLLLRFLRELGENRLLECSSSELIRRFSSGLADDDRALLRAAENGEQGVIGALVKERCELDTLEQEGFSALGLALREGRYEAAL